MQKKVLGQKTIGIASTYKQLKKLLVWQTMFYLES